MSEWVTTAASVTVGRRNRRRRMRGPRRGCVWLLFLSHYCRDQGGCGFCCYRCCSWWLARWLAGGVSWWGYIELCTSWPKGLLDENLRNRTSCDFAASRCSLWPPWSMRVRAWVRRGDPTTERERERARGWGELCLVGERCSDSQLVAMSESSG